jgi:hypothetical protein
VVDLSRNCRKPFVHVRLEREIGRGGMTVYLARDIKHDRSVAVKVSIRSSVPYSASNDS